MACESKKISELTEACQVNPNDILPIVQDGTNKYVKVKDLLKGKCGDDTQDDCCCSKALSKAVTALDFSRTAMDLANKAFDKACQVDTKLGALEQRVTELEQIICNIQSQITQIFNRFDQLEEGLTVTVVTTSETTLDKHEIKQGGITKGIIQVLRPTSNINQNGQGLPADAWQVRLALDGLKSEVTKNLTFVSGKFSNSGLTYNGTSPVSVNIPTALSQLDNDGNFLEGVRGHDGNLVQVVNHIAELGPVPTATSTVLGGIKVGYSQSGKKYPVKLDSNNKAYIDLTNLPTAENLDDLGDVDLTSPQNGDILYFDGTKWVNVPFEDILEQNCQTIIDCIGGTINFDVAPLEIVLAYNKRNTGGTPFSVTSDGAWIIRKKSGGSEFSADLNDDTPQTGNGDFLVTVNSDNNTGVNRSAVWTVYPKVTIPGRIEPIDVTIIQKTSHTITYVVTGSGTASDISGLPSGNTAKVNDGSNYTKSGILPKAGYEITSVTFNPNTRASYNTSTGKVSITKVETDVEITIEVNPSTTPQHKITYVIPNYDDKIDITPGDIYVNNGVTYIEDLAGAINDPRYEITGVTINPSSNGTYSNGELTIPDTVTTDTEVTINIAPKASGLSVNPSTINVIKNGTTQTTNVDITNSCATNGIQINRTGVPSGITTTLNSAKTKLTIKVTNSVANGTYTVTLTNDCGDTATVTINVSDAPATTLRVNPDTITVPQGQTTTNSEIEVSTTCTGGQINVRNLPTGITAVEENGHLKVTVQSSVAAGQYQFEVYDDCGNTHTVTVNVQASWLDNINLGVNGNQFNAFGVIEERFNANSSVAIDPAVSNPYQASTYTNGAATYDVNLGQGPSTDINYLKDHLYLRQQVVTGNEGGTDTSQYRETKLSDFDSSYEQKPSGSNYRYPFTADINLDGNNNVILSIACLPTDFADSDSIVITNTDNSTYSSQEVKGSYVVRELTLELMDDDGNIIDHTPSWNTNFSREIYCNKLFTQHYPDCYSVVGSIQNTYSIYPITSGYYQANQDETSDRTLTLAAWEVNNGKLGHTVTISPSTSGETCEIVKNGDVQELIATNLQEKQIYNISVTTNSTNSLNYPSLTSEQYNCICLNPDYKMHFSTNITDFMSTEAHKYGGLNKGNYPNHHSAEGNLNNLNYWDNSNVPNSYSPIYVKSYSVDKFYQIVIEDQNSQVSNISISQEDINGNIISGVVADLTDPTNPYYGETYESVMADLISPGCVTFAIVFINQQNQRHINIQFLGVVSDVYVTLNS